MKRLLNNKGQGTIEYTLLIGLVVVIVWVVIVNTGIGKTVKGIWGDVDENIPGGNSLSNKASSSGGGSGVSNGASGGLRGGSTSVSRNDGNANPQYSSVTNRPGQEQGVTERYSDENRAGVQEPPYSAGRALRGVSNISESQWNNLSMGLGLALFILIASMIPLIVWMRIKSVENSEVSFQGLQADQIIAKIKDTA